MSGLIRPDETRRIDLPGVGSVERPMEAGFDVTALRSLSLRAYRFEEGGTIDGDAEGDEVAIVLLRGSATIAVSRTGVDRSLGGVSCRVAGRTDPFDGPGDGIYLPPEHSYRLTLHAPTDVVYARSPADGRQPSARLVALPGPATDDARRTSLLSRRTTEGLRCDEIHVRPGGAWHENGHGERIVLVRTPQDAAAIAVVREEGGVTEHELRNGDALALAAGATARIEAPPGHALYLLTVGSDRTPSPAP